MSFDRNLTGVTEGMLLDLGKSELFEMCVARGIDCAENDSKLSMAHRLLRWRVRRIPVYWYLQGVSYRMLDQLTTEQLEDLCRQRRFYLPLGYEREDMIEQLLASKRS